MEDIIHYLIGEDVDIFRSDYFQSLQTWCGASVKWDEFTSSKLYLSRNPYKITCDECKEASALHLLGKLKEA